MLQAIAAVRMPYRMGAPRSRLLHAARALTTGAAPLPPPMRKAKPRLAPVRTAVGTDGGVCAAYCAKTPVPLSTVSSLFREGSGLHEEYSAGHVEICANDVVHVPLGVAADEARSHAFFFSSGAVVFWGVPLALRRVLLRKVWGLMDDGPTQARYGDEAMAMEDFDHEFVYRVDTSRRRASFKNDEIQLSDFEDSQQLLALSYGLAQSVNLCIHEEAVDVLVLRTRALPDELARDGRIRLPQRALKQLIGELLRARYSVSLVSDILDTPEYFWNNPGLEQLHKECTDAVELRQRARILDARVLVIKEALDMLNNELSSNSSNRVERAILFLIAVEVVLELARLAPLAIF